MTLHASVLGVVLLGLTGLFLLRDREAGHQRASQTSGHSAVAMRSVAPTLSARWFGDRSWPWSPGLLKSLERGSSVVVFGPTRSGKTRDVIAPILNTWQGSAIVTSVKDDIVNLTSGRRSAVSQVFRLGLTGESSDIMWDPVLDCDDFKVARRVANLLSVSQVGFQTASSESRFWYTLAERTLAPLLLAANRMNGGVPLVMDWISAGSLEPAFERLDPFGDKDARLGLDSLRYWDEKQLSSVLLTLTAVLEPIVSAIQHLTKAGSLTSVRALSAGVSPFTIYLISPLSDQRRLAPYFAALNSLLIDRALARSGVLGTNKTLVVLDEAANTAPLPELAELASVGSGLGVLLLTALQDISQLRTCYGLAANTVVNNHRSKLFLPGISDPETLALAEALIGDGPSRLPNLSIREQPNGTAVLIQGRTPPRSVRLNARRWPFSREFR